MAAMFLLLTLYMSTVMEYSPLSVGIAYLPFCAVLVAALAASAPLVTRHGHRPAACTAFTLAAAGLLLLSRVPAHDADALDLVPAMLLVALGLGLGLPALQGTALHGSTAADAGLARRDRPRPATRRRPGAAHDRPHSAAPASLGRSHAAPILLRFGATPRR